MSTYRQDSLLSRLNRAPSGEWFDVTSELLDVLEPARTLSELSGGAFDVTVGPRKARPADPLADMRLNQTSQFIALPRRTP